MYAVEFQVPVLQKFPTPAWKIFEYCSHSGHNLEKQRRKNTIPANLFQKPFSKFIFSMNIITKLFLFDFFATLFSGTVICRGEMSFELIPKILKITEVLSRRDQKTQETKKDEEVGNIEATELKNICTKAMELVQNEVTKNIKFKNELTYGERKRYTIKLIKDEWYISTEIVTAFVCPTEPAIYINVEIKDKETGKLGVSVIFKYYNNQPKLKSITAIAIRLAIRIDEACSDEISTDINLSESTRKTSSNIESNPKSMDLEENDNNANDIEDADSNYITEIDSEENLENSLIDIDNLQEYQRIEMCRRGTYILSDIDMKLNENEEAGPTKYYSLTTKQENTYLYKNKSKSMVDNTRTNTIEAFRCPTTPENIYLNVDEDDDYDDDEVDGDRSEEEEIGEKSLLWVIVKEDEWSPLFNIFVYRLKFYKEIMSVSEEEIAERRKMEIFGFIRDFAFNLDELGERSRYVICKKAILTTLRTGVELMENVEIEPTNFYGFKNGEVPIIVQVITCPTNYLIPVYVHIGMDLRTNKRAALVYIKKDENCMSQLFPWVEEE